MALQGGVAWTGSLGMTYLPVVTWRVTYLPSGLTWRVLCTTGPAGRVLQAARLGQGINTAPACGARGWAEELSGCEVGSSDSAPISRVALCERISERALIPP